MASLEKSCKSLQTGVGVEPLFMLRCDRSPVMLTWLHQFNKIATRLPSARASRKITEVHDLFLFMAFHKVILE
jgi:hypothetical protein